MFDLLGSLLVSLVVAWFVVWYGAQSFYTQKWWERKADTYDSLMAALYRLEKHYLRELVKIEQPSAVPAALWQGKSPDVIEHDEALGEIEREVAMGEFTVSADVERVLSGLLADLRASSGKATHLYEFYDLRVDIVRARMGELRRAAKRDLRLGPGRLKRWRSGHNPGK